MGARLVPAFRYDFSEASCDHSADQRSGEGLVDGELDGALGEVVGLEFVLELLDDGSGGEETAMVRKGGEPNEDFLVPEGGDAVADDFGRFRWRGGANHGAHVLESGASGFRNEGEVLVDGLRWLFGARLRGALPGSRFFRGRTARRPSGFHEAMLGEVSRRVQKSSGLIRDAARAFFSLRRPIDASGEEG